MTVEEKKIAEEAVNALPLQLSDEYIHIAEKRKLIGGDVIVYKANSIYDPLQNKKRIMAECHCTACGEEFYLEYAKKSISGCHNSYGYENSIGFYDPVYNSIIRNKEECMCPYCEMSGKAIHTSSFGNKDKYTIDDAWVLTVHNINGIGFLLTWYIERQTDKNGNISYIAHREEAIGCINGKMISAAGYVTGMFGAHCYYDRWQLKAKFTPDKFQEWRQDEIMPFDQDVTDKSTLCHSAIEIFLKHNQESKFYPSYYLKILDKYPNAENLIRNEFTKLIDEIIDKSSLYKGYGYNVQRCFSIKSASKYLNWKKKKPHEIIGLEKSEINIAKNGLIVLEIYKRAKKQKKRHEEILTSNNINYINKINGEILIDLIDPETYKEHGAFFPNIKRTLNYLSKIEGDIGDIEFLKDYWKMTLGTYSSIPKELEFPNDLKRAHDIAAEKYKSKINAEKSEKISERSKELKKFIFTDPKLGLTIIPPKDHEAFIKEGKALHHCVETYSGAHSTGKTTILFIRKLINPDKPFFTLEYRDGRVIQNRGLGNCVRTEEVKIFEKEWLNYIKGVAKNGKRNNSESKLCTAGA